mgnify:CR=1 FL=1|jgi:hypothetical protein|tara:strand:+ start:1457 stop:1702 length:246 start_codon:yes stop_codon:yes gene_type:complete
MSDQSKKIYQQNYYITKRAYILNLLKMPRDKLNEKQQIDLDKYINKFRPKTARALRQYGTNHNKGEKIFKIEKRQVTISFD